MNPFTIVAHRGGKGPYKENTLQAFQHAIDYGADAVEMDMRFDHYKQRFYLEHDFLHWPSDRKNTIEKVIPYLVGKTFFVIELKTLSWVRKKYALKFLEAVKKYDLMPRSLMISYNPFILLQLRKFSSGIQLGFICPSFFRWNLFKKWILGVVRPQYVLLHQRMLKKSVIHFARQRGLKILSYTMNNDEEWLMARKLEVDGIITDFPQEARRVLE